MAEHETGRVVGDPSWKQVWRIHWRFIDGRREHVDAYGLTPQFSSTATVAARDEMRRRHGRDGYWLEAWQPLIVPVGEWDVKKRRVVIKRPPIRRRVRQALASL